MFFVWGEERLTPLTSPHRGDPGGSYPRCVGGGEHENSLFADFGADSNVLKAVPRSKRFLQNTNNNKTTTTMNAIQAVRNNASSTQFSKKVSLPRFVVTALADETSTDSSIKLAEGKNHGWHHTKASDGKPYGRFCFFVKFSNGDATLAFASKGVQEEYENARKAGKTYEPKASDMCIAPWTRDNGETAYTLFTKGTFVANGEGVAEYAE